MTDMDAPTIGFCHHCQKQAYRSRKDARTAGRRRFPGDKIQGYRCSHIDGAWHIGHVAAEVKSGEIPKHLFYGPRGVGRVREKQGTRIVRSKAS
ncbi:hypothetical protein [Nocardia sp. NPDC057455]|uniref:hypothetical protein n=1 Tax=Nocardia sp. NPDC057455 TaxID=3346138 RepID=UPI0036719898